MQSPREILSDVWTSVGGDPAALGAVTLTGEEPQLPSSFRVAAAAQVSIAASGLAAAEIWKMRSGEAQTVAVDMRHAAVECRSERYLRVDNKLPPPAKNCVILVCSVPSKGKREVAPGGDAAPDDSLPTYQITTS